ncbi:MAG: tRNA guanosine(34) transglycosylase Tgt [Hydrotalea flava]|uniref:tRNA guanosine(34) transglycosylase Tgt n=1 Tax=Hydrotalea TaxID=1004300 RepID=UPI000943E811|nr:MULTISPECIES: tRNA guanosine(34) transglycosylase Tgt [Hydrotalea]MBY0348971.1 tRNA guanosine(34) transglycosylase Tgt [Hydrotalea flava]NIM35172.1 tRNA guanosine(34) transglycosylase Tgt [Hydrotalea flava]NIM37993.1 tRNA guanosine(34) transglycosylase Tgt [Hydrotalea flava]NIN03162.1 tRNA guanosine(34) transglycosylase Tgt [Hydrotalea flava]NIN14852.1 tRNA guanosine(34) transglycosylase Tgt [Hydrotalea flava]
MPQLQFSIQETDVACAARAGTIITDHGSIQTPIFMPVGTGGSVKAITQQQLQDDIHAQIILGNTYHLYLRPGTDILQQAGGLHKFMGWNRPILTDSGGYQVFSLATQRKIKEEGVTFQSHIDGSRHLFTPEYVMDIQRSIGADIIMAFDECPPYPSDYAYAKNSMELTHRWLDRGIARLAETPDLYGYTQNLFPIVQGGTFKDLRTASCAYIASKQAAGNAIGGLSVGEPEEMMYDFTALCCSILPSEKPRYLMGVGTPWNILEGIALGVDMFDCVMPTRNGRNGMLFTSKGIINIKNKKWATDFSVIDDGIPASISNYYSKAYLRHLFAANEISALQIASLHNLSFYLWLVAEARTQILLRNFNPWKQEMVPILKQRL